MRLGPASVIFLCLAGAPAAAQTTATTPPRSPFTLGGYTEAFYQWNFNRPSNGITNFRGFDNRHNTFTLSNIALDAGWDDQNLIGKVTLQVGHTPSTYYLNEPALAGASGANATGTELWKYAQQAYAGWRFGIGNGLTLVGGLMLSPIGPEAMAVRDNWNWSRSNLFVGLPFYHTGVKASYPLSATWSLTLGAFNGWNSVVDNNSAKSILAQATYTGASVGMAALYFGGVERAQGAAEGDPWRHLFDAHVRWDLASRITILSHANAGVEQNRFGMSRWMAAALYGRLRIAPTLYVAVRGDAFFEHVAQNRFGGAAPIVWPAPWVASGTLTIDYRPHERASLRLEYRQDHAGEAMYFGRGVQGDGAAMPFVANRQSQSTLLAGVTTWF